MAIIKSHFNYIGYGCNGWYFGLSAIEQAESRREIEKLGYFNSPKEKHLYGITERQKRGKGTFDVTKDNLPFVVSKKGGRNPLYLVRIDVEKVIAGWKESWPDHKLEFEDDLKGRSWDSIKRDELVPQYHQHQIDAYITHYFNNQIFDLPLQSLH